MPTRATSTTPASSQGSFFLVGFKLKIKKAKQQRNCEGFKTFFRKAGKLRDQKKMASETNKTNGSKSGGGSGFRAKLDRYLYSGEKKHVIAGIAVIGVIFGVPWYLMTKGSKHQSHQDYMEKADKARSERLSKGLQLPACCRYTLQVFCHSRGITRTRWERH